MSRKVLLIDDDSTFSKGLCTLLQNKGIKTEIAESPQKALELYRTQINNFDLLLIDYHFHNSELTGSDLALKIKELNPLQDIIFLTGQTSLIAVDSMLETGAAKTFIRKGDDLQHFLDPILKTLKYNPALDQSDLDTEIKRSSLINSIGLIGRSEHLYNIAEMILQVRQFKSRFLIIGDSGSGKEKIAQAFKKQGKPFYALNCANFSSSGEQFVESQLFGHQKGAFTGAIHDQKGAFEIAEDGILFLDEIHHLSLAAQAKLLRAIQENKFRRLGENSKEERKFNATLVAATKPVIFEMMAAGTFLKDLFYRLKVKEINVSPLANRHDDIKPLAEYFCRKIAEKFQKNVHLSPQLIRELEAYNWPGNVRELENFIEEAAMMSRSEIIGPDYFRSYINSQNGIQSIYNDTVRTMNLDYIVSTYRTDQIIEVLKTSSTVEDAAQKLSTKRTTLNGWMKKLNIDPKLYLTKKTIGV